MLGESKASRLAADFQEHIESAELEAGTFLGTKSTLLEQHQVAAGTLNEALRLLQVRGYIDVKPGPKGGAFVASKAKRTKLTDTLLAAQDDPTQVETYIQIQDALEVLVAVTAAGNATDEDAARIKESVVRLEAADGPREILNAVWEVDREIARATGNRILSDIYCGVLDALQDSLQWFSIGRAITDANRRNHIELAQAVINNDVEAAERAAYIHSPGNAAANTPPGPTRPRKAG